MQVTYLNGIHLPEWDLWLDPHHTRPHAWVTHAHSDHTKPHGSVYATSSTAAMMRGRGATRSRFHERGFGEAFPWGKAQVTLLPAGHVLGSAQVLVEAGGTRLLYSGDFKLRPGLSAEPIQVPKADILIMETTFGRPRYRFPPAAEVAASIMGWCQETLDQGCTPVLLCYSLGKGQEVLAALAGASFPIFLQHAHWQMTEVYAQCGQQFPEYRLFQPGQSQGGVLLCAGGCRRQGWYAQVTNPRTAYVSGWAVDGPHRFGADTAFALSDHADYPDLLEYVRLTGARTVFTLHGFAKLFAADLRNRGIEARPIEEAGLGKARGQLSLF